MVADPGDQPPTGPRIAAEDQLAAALLRIRRLNRSAFTKYIEGLEEPISRAFQGWLRDLTFREFYSRASKYGWKLPQDLFVASRLERRLRVMQARLYL